MIPHSKVFNQLPDEAKAIREQVFVIEQGFTEEFDSVDLAALHFVVYDGDLPIGTARMFPSEEENTYIIGRIAVVRDYRGKGIGRFVLGEAEKYAADIGAYEIKLHSQYRAKEFYEKCGYLSFGEIDYEEDCPHIWMRKYFNSGEI